MKQTGRTFARLLAAHALDDPALVMLPENEQEAKELLASGWPVDVQRRIFTGRPCTHGHVAPRQVSGYCCVQCNRIHAQGYNQRPEVKLRNNAKARSQYREKPPSEESKAIFREYMKGYCQRPHIKDAHRRRMRSVTAERNARKLKATPPWLTDQHRAQIDAIYEEARRITEETGIKHEVDHIVPLKAVNPFTGKRNACGLHVPWNLQILTRQANASKLNRFDGGWSTV
jgi:hypothetical protein